MTTTPACSQTWVIAWPREAPRTLHLTSQRRLVEGLPPGPVDVDVIHKVTPKIGGAYFDLLDLPDRRVGLVVAQASETGIAAAVNTVMVGTLM